MLYGKNTKEDSDRKQNWKRNTSKVTFEKKLEVQRVFSLLAKEI